MEPGQFDHYCRLSTDHFLSFSFKFELSPAWKCRGTSRQAHNQTLPTQRAMDLRLVFPKTCSVEVPSWHNAPERKAKTEAKLIALYQVISISIFAPGHLCTYLCTRHSSLSLLQVIFIFIFVPVDLAGAPDTLGCCSPLGFSPAGDAFQVQMVRFSTFVG